MVYRYSHLKRVFGYVNIYFFYPINLKEGWGGLMLIKKKDLKMGFRFFPLLYLFKFAWVFYEKEILVKIL